MLLGERELARQILPPGQALLQKRQRPAAQRLPGPFAVEQVRRASVRNPWPGAGKAVNEDKPYFIGIASEVHKEGLPSFEWIEPEEQERLITELGAERALRVIESMDPEEGRRFAKSMRSFRPRIVVNEVESAEEIKLIPGMTDRMVHEFEEYRPYEDMAEFDREIGKYVDEAEVARFRNYVTL